MKQYYQRILFGSPGTGKSKKVYDHYLSLIGIDDKKGPNTISTVFHPEYGYGDFMGKLVPYTENNDVTYKYYPGDFLKALIRSYYNILDNENGEPQKVALIIDEINRGNSAEIFGKVFQLLDRHNEGENKGWSEYRLDINQIQKETILDNIGVEFSYDEDGNVDKYKAEWGQGGFLNHDTLISQMKEKGVNIRNDKIGIPPNLSIFATMNTSNESVYFMDSAFKRRWNWEFVDIGGTEVPEPEYGRTSNKLLTEGQWYDFVEKINKFMKEQHNYIRGIEDKQIGYYFVVERPVTSQTMRSKVMFFVWDTVFDRDKEPLEDLMGMGSGNLITFGDFIERHNKFVNSVLKF